MIQTEYLYLSFLVSVIFFILKQFMYRKTPIPDQNKLFFQESFYLFVILLVAFYVKDYVQLRETKTEIFTGDPSF